MTIHGDYIEGLTNETESLYRVVMAISDVLNGKESYENLKDSAEFMTRIANMLDDSK